MRNGAKETWCLASIKRAKILLRLRTSTVVALVIAMHRFKICSAPASFGERKLLQKVLVVWDSIPAAADSFLNMVPSTVGILAAGWQLSPPTKLRMARGSLLEETWTAAEGVRSYAQVDIWSGWRCALFGFESSGIGMQWSKSTSWQCRGCGL